MKKLILCTSLLIIICAAGCRDAGGPAGIALYDSVDMELERSHVYEQAKEQRIECMRRELARTDRADMQAEVIERLVSEFEAYNSDSAIHYINQYMALPTVKAGSSPALRMTIRKADIVSHAGLYREALEILAGSRPAHDDTAMLVEYYGVYGSLYQYQSEYTTDSEFLKENERMRAIYNDSLLAVCRPSSYYGLVVHAPRLVREGNIAQAEKLLLDALGDYQPGTRRYSVLASILAYVYAAAGDTRNHRRYLALSAISDLRGAVKENMALRALATALFEDGDIERANRYLKQSFADANFFAARMRNAQSSRMLPVIDEAYNANQAGMQRIQRRQIIAISLLAFVLLLAIAFILRQFKAVKQAQRNTAAAYAELSDLSDRLREANAGLEKMNADLRASNSAKEESVSIFMEFCSSTISSVKNYQQSLRVLAAQQNMTALVRKLASSEIIDNTLKEFYQKFDEAVLSIYPSFVEKFNHLLRPDEQVILRPGELLNTELRVYALIRIGIDDSAKIARFLRCSITTVYTYRSKMRKRALNADTFESDVARIR